LAFDEALGEADLFFQAEMPAVQPFRFGPADADRVTQPVLNVLGAESVSRFVEGADLVQTLLPHAERLSVPEAGHLLMVQKPDRRGRRPDGFVSRHRLDQTRSWA
jgi:pimeloyl-ACP methyl ester carboxylesterase